MKRELFDNVRVIPDAAGAVIDREGFLSAVIGFHVGTVTGDPDGVSLAVKVEHCDTADGTFEVVPDSRLDPEHVTEGGTVRASGLTDGGIVCLNLDLLGCKRFIKLTPTVTVEDGTVSDSEAADGETSSDTGTSSEASAAAMAVVLGDPTWAPV